MTSDGDSIKNVPDGTTSHEPREASSAAAEDQGSSMYPSTERDPFWMCVPQVAGWAYGIVKNEVGIVQHAVQVAPSWTAQFLSDTHTYYRANPRILMDEVLSGFTVAIMQVPESIAFSFVAGVPPLSGLQATFWMAVITGIFGGKPGMISGAAGALAVVATDLTSDDGPLDYLSPAERLNVLYMTMFVCGCMQIGFAALRLAQLVRLIPETGLIGFMNGLAIIIFMAQLPAFQYCDDEPKFIECTLEQRQWLTFSDHPWETTLSLVHVAICMAIMKYFPSVPKVGKIIPSSLMGLLVGTLLEHTLFQMVFDVSTRTVDETAPINGNLPRFNWPAIPGDGDTIGTMFEYAITLATIGSVESVLTLQACNEITDTVAKISDSSQELFAQGLANLVSGLFSAMGGDAMIGQSTINIMNGARHRVSSTMSGVFMLLFIVALSPFINLLPVSTLTGVLFMVVLSTFQWKTFVILRYGRISDSFAILLVTLIAVFFNLAVAIGIGIVFSALIHAWDSGCHVDADSEIKAMIINGEECEARYVHIKGAIFFSSTRKFVDMFSPSNDADTVILDFKDALIIDHSAVAAIQGIAHRYSKVGKRVLFVNLPVKGYGRMHRTGDHEALRKQITFSHQISAVGSTAGNAPSSVKDVESPASASDEEERTSSNKGSESDSTDDAPDGVARIVIDEGRVGEKLSSLHMFQSPTEAVEMEIAHLQDAQGEVDIHEKTE